MLTGNRKVMLLLVVVMLAFFFPAQPVTAAQTAEEDNEEAMVTSGNYLSHVKSGILYEATTGTVIYEKDADMQLPPASMTKVMTAILVLEENPELEGELTVDERAVSSLYCSSMVPLKHLEAGEVISYKDCMRYLLVPSGNEAATAFAFAIAGDMYDFLDMMNEKAKELGCTDTHFQDPTGISATDHYTTARDMVKICEYAMSFDAFREAVSHSDGEVPPSNVRDEGFTYETTNYVMFPDDRYESPYAEYMTGVKTGWTPAAGWCFSGCMERDGLVYYSVVMGGEELPYEDGERIVQGDFLDTIELYTLTDDLKAAGPEELPEDMTVASLLGAGSFSVGLSPDTKLLIREGETVEAEFAIPSFVAGTVRKGDPVGTVTLKTAGREKTFDLVAQETRTVSPWVVCAVLVLLAAAVLLAARVRRKKRSDRG